MNILTVGLITLKNLTCNSHSVIRALKEPLLWPKQENKQQTD